MISNTIYTSGTFSVSNSTTISSTTINTASQSTNIAGYSTYASSVTFNIYKIEIEVLGKKFSIPQDTFQQLYLTQIDFHGISFYKSLKKNGLKINDENIKNYLDVLERETKIDNILKNL